ncbi:hypothetical protein GE061_012180 [Apolygus lucorum]|uniref:FAM20 C-terminal domain-containing protein n=1 Tax=Apolygus lucorum TaxID=248454 RepID=A0A8S9XRV9_APOLU|nr:hypothetical protein GE061_012180 [Apolygus lucorum]
MTILDKFRRKYRFVFLCLILFGISNVYLIHVLIFESSNDFRKEELKTKTPYLKENFNPLQATDVTNVTLKRISSASEGVNLFFTPSIFSTPYSLNFSALLISDSLPRGSDVWEIASKWVTDEHIVPGDTRWLSHVQNALRNSEVLSADVSTKGTQLKLALILEGGQKALFKPKWYDRDQVLVGQVYGGKDRHNGEIAAFYLARLLGLNRVPIVVGRKFNLATQILPVSTATLSRTFFKKNNNTCFYGVCMYCKLEDGVCADGHTLEGAVVLWLPNRFRLVKQRHPWQRTYTPALAKWQIYGNYCSIVKKWKVFQSESHLLDLVETSIFDFLIDNGDRHHYERFADNGKVLLIDNGKSFGNPDVDHMDILAPLFQCCRVRELALMIIAGVPYWFMGYTSLAVTAGKL